MHPSQATPSAALACALGAACVLALTACSAAPTSTPAAHEASSASTTLKTMAASAESGNTGAGLTPLGDANTTLKTERPGAPSQLLVTNIRTGKHEGFERVVFDLEGTGTPGWFIDFTDRPTQQGSGNTVKVDGDAALNVNIDGTVLPFEVGHDDPGLKTTDGHGGFITQVVPVGTFEGRSQFFIGLKGQHAYSVQALKEPTRLVIDILS